eukprot:Plantae.Rhodophyta-Hildenbrandia_rubra.ctg668.p1 GENE.Plantae.Rhodophyta-Hildenbrandia_rubra.ctg668~~Plantae.Rhodophyta-Hildenbrandia_rubra.ctg668.p1  ORF type:complete len:1211 (+),score=209.98 Plantae.Rhodophyta-Hildenbrandia_rubra.ctg668:965-4597(+)
MMEALLQVVRAKPVTDKVGEGEEKSNQSNLTENLRRTAIFYASDMLWGVHRVLPLADEVDWAEQLNAFIDALGFGGWHIAREIELSIKRLISKYGEGLSRTEWVALRVLLKKLKVKHDFFVENKRDYELSKGLPPREALAEEIANFQLALFAKSWVGTARDTYGNVGMPNDKNDDVVPGSSVAAIPDKVDRLEYATGWGVGLDNITDIYKDHLREKKVLEILTLRAARARPTPEFVTWVDGLQRIVTFYFVKEHRPWVQFKVINIVRKALFLYPELYADALVRDVLQTFSAEEDATLGDEAVVALLQLYTDVVCQLPLSSESVDIVLSNICGVADGAQAESHKQALAALNAMQDIFIAQVKSKRTEAGVKAFDAIISPAFTKTGKHRCAVQAQVAAFLRCISTTSSFSVRIHIPISKATVSNDQERGDGTTKKEYLEALGLRTRCWNTLSEKEATHAPGVLDIRSAVEKLVTFACSSKCKGTILECLQTLLWVAKDPRMMYDINAGDWVARLLKDRNKRWTKEEESQAESKTISELRKYRREILYQLHGFANVPLGGIIEELIIGSVRSNVRRLYQLTTVLCHAGEEHAGDNMRFVVDTVERIVLSRRQIKPISKEVRDAAQDQDDPRATMLEKQSNRSGGPWGDDNAMRRLDDWDFAGLECLCALFPVVAGCKEVGVWAQRALELVIRAMSLGQASRKTLIRGQIDRRRRWRQLSFYLCGEVAQYTPEKVREALLIRVVNEAMSGFSLPKAIAEHLLYFVKSGTDEPHVYSVSDEMPTFLVRDDVSPAVVTLRASALPGISVCQHRATGNIRYTVSSSMLGRGGPQFEREMREAQSKSSNRVDVNVSWAKAGSSNSIVKSEPSSPSRPPRKGRELGQIPRSASFSELFSLPPHMTAGESSTTDEKIDVFTNARCLVSKLGFGAGSNIVHLKGNAAKIQRMLSTLSTIEVTGTHKIGVVYVRRDNRDEKAVFTNNAGCPKFSMFLKSLGDVHGRTSTSPNVYTGGFDCESETHYQGPYLIHWRGPVQQITFDAPPLMWNKYGDHKEDTEFVQKKKQQFGNDFVTIIFSETGSLRDTELFETNYKTVRIVVAPVAGSTVGDVYSVTVIVTKPTQVRCGDIPMFGPLFPRKEPHIVEKSSLASLVRMTAMNANIACLSVGLPMERLNWEVRAETIEKFGDDSYVFSEKKKKPKPNIVKNPFPRSLGRTEYWI